MTSASITGPTDEELLDLLAGALGPAPAEPSAAGLAALSCAVDDAFGPRAAIATPRTPWWKSKWRRAWLGVALIGGSAVAGSGAAFASGAALPEPVRAVAFDLGLPVDSPTLVHARQTEKKLERDLSQASPTPSQAAATERESNALAHLMAMLSPSDEAKAGPGAVAVITEAQRYESSHRLPITTIPAPFRLHTTPAKGIPTTPTTLFGYYKGPDMNRQGGPSRTPRAPTTFPSRSGYQGGDGQGSHPGGTPLPKGTSWGGPPQGGPGGYGR